MELKKHLKEHRQRLGLSQEDLAERIFATRQTISNWEMDKTYPDVQSLLLLSDLFGVSIDEFAKGDVAAMESEIKREWKRMSRLIAAAWGLIALGILCAVAGFVAHTGPSSVLPGWSEGEVLGCVAFLFLWLIGLGLAHQVERMKKASDLVTYKDILAFSKGEQPVRDNDVLGRRQPLASNALKFIAAALVGLAIAFVVARFL
ncbi:helix-turn-helix transcriptional regulator [Adlercreutzia equolifaciens]|uniref:helix-turn-helix transcriptional regulator n=1 Tax=Adlercreutzia equolifaciens TaxID=446660 RepID=UPI0023B0D946|nr:helix-turn-helix transcriptional regulator [Adlercreutzia equolifaciens]MDE8701802.1 helix-turn-helix transcriptional regulator [Adlercreutzia equolifaciens]